MPQKIKYGSSKQSSMSSNIGKKQLVLSSQRAKVFQISRRFSNDSQKSSKNASVRNSKAMRLN